jgi:phosphate transport system permease protein
VLALVGLIVYELISGSKLSWHASGLKFFFRSEWDPVNEQFGALPFVFGTLVSSFLALLIAVPLAIGVAVFITEMSPPWLRGPLAFTTELLAAIPSVIYGLWAIFVLVPLLRQHGEPFLARYFGWTSGIAHRLGFQGPFEGPPYGIGMLAAGIILAIMVVPIVSSITREVMTAVPQQQREAVLALGATRWEMIRTGVLRNARAGILGGVILGLGRALGETMAVTMVIGNRPEIASSLFAPGYTMASVIANEFSEATGNTYLSALIEIGLALFIVTIIVNILAQFLVWTVTRGTVARSHA